MAPPNSLAPLSDVSVWARSNLLLVIVVITGSVLITRAATWFSERLATKIDQSADQTDALVRSEANKHRHAVIQVVTWAILVLIYCIAAVAVVHLFGLPLTGFVAPATVAGVALGFGAQRVVQDILSGFFIVAERQYGFGDVVRLAAVGATATTGTVEEVTLRITRIRSLDGEVITTPNGQIVQVTNLSRDWARAVIDVPVPVTADVSKVSDILRSVCSEAFEDEQLHRLLLDAPSVMGVESLAVDQFNVRVVARTLPGKQFEVGRSLRARITQRLRREGIMVAPSVDIDEPTGSG
ncbi:MAG TPA: mechanosensitive ion channel family protein [Jatrophihabitans sp.]|nr:mechanosensitive ion channel family protein [Jatrophihabitans sp.]